LKLQHNIVQSVNCLNSDSQQSLLQNILVYVDVLNFNSNDVLGYSLLIADIVLLIVMQ